MRFAQNRPVKIVMLGAGGTGGHIAPHLYRLLYALGQRECRFLIVGGDLVEKKNLVRQNFIEADLGESKAKVLAERYSSVFGLETEYIPSYVESEEELKKLVTPRVWKTSQYYSAGKWRNKTLTELVILIGAVDNNRSWSLCHRVFYQMKDLVYIGSCTAQEVVSLRRYLPDRLLSGIKKLLSAPFRKLTKPKKNAAQKPVLSLPKEPVPKPEPDSELVSAILESLREKGYTISPSRRRLRPGFTGCHRQLFQRPDQPRVVPCPVPQSALPLGAGGKRPDRTG